MKHCALKIISWIGVAATSCFVSLSSCSFRAKSTNLEINGHKNVVVGHKTQYTISDGTNLSIDVDVQWCSTNTDVADIDQNGVLIPYKKGQTQLIAKIANEGKITKNVFVYNDAPQSIEITGETTIDAYTEAQYKATVFPSTAPQNVKWSVKEDFATITDKGVLTVNNSDGVDVHVIATSTILTYVEAELIVHVRSIAPTSLKIIGKTTVCMKDDIKYEVEVEPEHASKKVEWEVDDTSIAYISQEGQLTPLKEGQTNVTAKSSIDKTIEAEPLPIEIIEGARPESIELVGSHWLPIGQAFKYTIHSRPDNTLTNARWSISDPSIATVTSEGEVTASKEGTFTLTATSVADDTIVSTMDVTAMPADQLISCTFNETIGHAFDMYYDAYIPRNDGNKFTIRFESTRWGEDEDSIILHNELKQSDLEVIYNGTNISGSCYLHRNVLITPKLSNSIVINILGAEISEWCDWDTLSIISDEDDADEEHDIVQQYFQVGDYKKAYYRIGKEDPDEDPNPWKSSTFKIIDMHHDSYFGQSSEGEKENKPVAFTFYSNDVNYSHRWQDALGDPNHTLIYKWEQMDELEIRAEVIDMIEFVDFVPHIIGKTAANNIWYDNNTACFVLSDYELWYTDPMEAEEYWIQRPYAYFDINKYHSLASLQQRRSRGSSSNGYWINNWMETTRELTDRFWDECYWADSNGSEYHRSNTPLDVEQRYEVAKTRDIILAFCI